MNSPTDPLASDIYAMEICDSTFHFPFVSESFVGISPGEGH